VVGGRAMMETSDNPSRLATYGAQGESAMDAGQQVMKDAEAGVARDDRTGLAGSPPPPPPVALPTPHRACQSRKEMLQISARRQHV